VIQIALGTFLAAAVALLAYRARSLSAGGAAAAFAIGAMVFGAGGWPAALVLFAFFIPSTLLSRLGKARKRALLDVGKQGPRDAWQVLANGGIAALCVLLAMRFGTPLWAAFAGAFAAASADTWGTEIGTLAAGKPRSILTFAPIEPGLSGGITFAGTLATIGGAVCVALVAWLAHVGPFLPIAVAGIAGAFLDSVLGASTQALRHCAACNAYCETNPHHCGTPTTLRRGFAWMENDAINAAATLAGAAVAGCWALEAGRCC
jgi:uncharacterized protein (TIGR00297 family)